jgi:hypothetical protein
MAAGAEPDRESVNLPRNEVSGELIRLDGEMRVSIVPGEAWGAADPEQPTNCMVVLDAGEDANSYLGGLVLDLAWNATLTGATELAVLVEGAAQVGWVTRVEARGTSPLHLVFNESATEGEPIRTPLRVTVGVPAGAVPPLDQPIAWALQVGILESRITALQWQHCSPVHTLRA